MTISPNAILIIQGNLSAEWINVALIDNQGTMIVTGEVFMGIISAGDFTNSGDIYLFDDDPYFPPIAVAFDDVDCPTCTGDEDDLAGDTDLNDFFNSSDATAPVPVLTPLSDKG